MAKKRGKDKRATNRRYVLHQRIKADFHYSAARRTIDVPADSVDNITRNVPAKVAQALFELRDKFAYTIQPTIVNLKRSQ